MKLQEAEKAAQEQAKNEYDVARGNPLLNRGSGDFQVKRRWDDDVIFKNQARGTDDKNKKKEFVNDLLRSDFHKRFMVSLLFSPAYIKPLSRLGTCVNTNLCRISMCDRCFIFFSLIICTFNFQPSAVIQLVPPCSTYDWFIEVEETSKTPILKIVRLKFMFLH